MALYSGGFRFGVRCRACGRARAPLMREGVYFLVLAAMAALRRARISSRVRGCWAAAALAWPWPGSLTRSASWLVPGRALRLRSSSMACLARISAAFVRALSSDLVCQSRIACHVSRGLGFGFTYASAGGGGSAAPL